jgi:uncharacterized protein
MTSEERKVLEDYLAVVRNRYGTVLVDILVFGSRARGDASADSDVDLAVVLADGSWDFYSERMALTRLAFDSLLQCGLTIEAWPVSCTQWSSDKIDTLPFFIDAARSEARAVSEAA